MTLTAQERLDRGRAAHDLLTSPSYSLAKASLEAHCKEIIFADTGATDDVARRVIWDRYHAFADLSDRLGLWAQEAEQIERDLAADEFNPENYSEAAQDEDDLGPPDAS